jgi:BarA-like signal transduction histidine kinase
MFQPSLAICRRNTLPELPKNNYVFLLLKMASEGWSM